MPNKLTEAQKLKAYDLFDSIQKSLTTSFEKIDGGAKTVFKSWERQEGGGGTMGVIRGKTVEKAGANVSKVWGDNYPSVDEAHKGQKFTAAGVSTITHMYNPYAPIGHMNVRLLEVGEKFWVGGGADLTPCFKFEEDTREFHHALKQACDLYSQDAYDKFSKWCDEYFYITHRKEIRGVGGVFFDYLEGDFEKLYELISAVSHAYAEVFPKILERRKNTPFTEEEKEQQLFWRGRYAEFNLAYDRGTRFGLLSGGNYEAIFVSLPPHVKW